jgi:hypothetical protein
MDLDDSHNGMDTKQRLSTRLPDIGTTDLNVIFPGKIRRNTALTTRDRKAVDMTIVNPWRIETIERMLKAAGKLLTLTKTGCSGNTMLILNCKNPLVWYIAGGVEE